MKTFWQYFNEASGREFPMFNSRDPDFDINLGMDKTMEDNDFQQFIFPVLKNLRAFYYYCSAVARKFLYNDIVPRHDNPTRQNLSTQARTARLAGNLGILGKNEYNDLMYNLISYVGTCSHHCFVDLRGFLENFNYDIIDTTTYKLQSINESIRRIEELLQNPTLTILQQKDHEDIKISLRRILSYLEKILPRLREIRDNMKYYTRKHNIHTNIDFSKD